MTLKLNNLHSYQRAIANFIVNKPRTFVIAEMGLGKTAPTLFAIKYLLDHKSCHAALILAPLRVVYTSWPHEITKWDDLRGMSYHIIHGRKKTVVLPDRDLYLSNYESLSFIIENKLYKACDILVIDESTMIKNHKTKRFKFLKSISERFKKIILLTGTPSPSGMLTEFFTQTFILDNGKRFSKSFWTFQQDYYIQLDRNGYKWGLKKESRNEIEKKVRNLCIVLRSQDYLKLPPLIFTTIYIQLPSKIRAQYDILEEDFLINIDKNIITVANAAVMSSKLRQITAGALYHQDGKEYSVLHKTKIEALKEIIDGTVSNVLCVFQFKFERFLLQKAFPEAEFLDGSTSPSSGDQLIYNWNNKKIKLLCCHPQSAGHGLNLQGGGNVLVWLSPDWSLERTLQMNARLYRQGQKSKVFIYNIICSDSIDMVVANTLKNKEEGQEAIVNALKEYSKEAYARLL